MSWAVTKFVKGRSEEAERLMLLVSVAFVTHGVVL